MSAASSQRRSARTGHVWASTPLGDATSRPAASWPVFERRTRATAPSARSSKLIDTGELTAYKIGRTIRLREQDLQDYLDRSRIQPGELRHLYPEESGAADIGPRRPQRHLPGARVPAGML